MIVYDHLEGFLPHAADAAGMAAAATVTAKFEIAGAHTPALAHRLAARPAAARQLIRHLVRVVTVAPMAATVRKLAAVTVALGAALVARQPRKQISACAAVRATPVAAATATKGPAAAAVDPVQVVLAVPEVPLPASHLLRLRARTPPSAPPNAWRRRSLAPRWQSTSWMPHDEARGAACAVAMPLRRQMARRRCSPAPLQRW